jgi:metal-dependent amidase/aminoacylase/carboxypeptidase family protein
MTISASIRSFSRETHQKVLGHIEKYTKMLCEVNGAQYTFEDLNNNHYRVVKNDPSAITVVKWAAESLF